MLLKFDSFLTNLFKSAADIPKLKVRTSQRTRVLLALTIHLCIDALIICQLCFISYTQNYK